MNQYIEVRLDGESVPEKCLLQQSVKIGEEVIVLGPEGEEWGIVSSSILVLPLEIECSYEVIRVASEDDFRQKEELNQKVEEVLEHARNCAEEQNLDMHFTHGTYVFSGKKMCLYFHSQSRIDFRNLLKDIWSLVHCRVELRQYRERDQARFHGGIGPCGRVLCCCRKTHPFRSITVYMAKTQGIPLSKEKGAGMCGQWFCCLGYEQETYEEELAHFPKLKSIVRTPDGSAQVVHNYPLRGEVTVQYKKGDERIFQTYPLGKLEFDKTREENCALQKKNNRRSE